ncbi:CDC45 domain containing protein [Trichuris trichiura]|uniref:CDC45 domain containing protein n=1 Tax=Trichuris trichiura TaxID=36087 RepID=A0A077Z495_TRITR|nr:CDC45 domain containing protein [Trichuris trichiura]
MLVTDFKRDFYSVVKRKHVLILSSYEVDSLCCCKILQFVFEEDDTTYSLVPVGDTEALLKAYMEYNNKVCYVILVNCGAAIDLIDLLQPSSETIFFVIDNKRPLNLNNVYESKQIRILIDIAEVDDLNIPPYESVCLDSDDEEDAGSDDDILASPAQKRSAKHSTADKIAWENKRNELLISYYEFSYYSMASSMLVYSLVRILSCDVPDPLWWALIGWTSQLVEGQISLPQYTTKSVDINQRDYLNFGRQVGNRNKLSKDCLTIHFETELLISLYRHWTLYDSIRFSRTTASFFRSWTLKGSTKLNEFLVHAGLPLTECRQEYNMMEIDLKNESKESLENTFERYEIEDVIYGSFYAKYSYSHKLSACDMAEALAAILFFDKDPCSADSFFVAMNTLSKIQQVGNILAAHMESTLSVVTCRSRSKRHKNKPFVVIVSLQNRDSASLVAGIPPLYIQTSGDKPKNLFGQAFLRIAERTTCRIRQKFFESHVVELYAEDTDRFLTGLVGLLQD